MKAAKKRKRAKPAPPPEPIHGNSAYLPEYAERAKVLCEGGATDADLASEFEACERTIRTWRAKHPEFREACKVGKDAANAEVKRSLYQNAIQGDTAAQIFWLKNRCPTEWRDRSQHELMGEGGGPIRSEGTLSDLETARLIARALLLGAKAEPQKPDDADPGSGTESA